MENIKEKNGIFNVLKGKKKDKKSSCCCSFEIEELPEDKNDNNTKDSPKLKDNSFCKK